MCSRPENSRQFIAEFIELYKSLPCLWHIKSAQYRNKALKHKAYCLLVQKYRESDPEATKQTVKSKINALRTTYRKALSRLNHSIQSGATGAELYRPSLWYFHLFDFLRDLEPQSVERNDYSELKKEEEYAEDTQESEELYYSSDPFAHASPIPSQLAPADQHFITSTSKRALMSSRKRATTESTVPSESMFSMQREEDPYDLFGRHIANKLRSLTPHQNVYAQKLINDVLFEAEMESLTRECKIVTEH